MKFLSEKDDVITAVLSKPAKRAAEQASGSDVRSKVKLCKAGDVYRTETTAGTQVFHGKLERVELDDFFCANIPAFFKNAVIETATETITILANKKGKCTVLRKAKSDVRRADLCETVTKNARGSDVREASPRGTFSPANTTDMRNVQLLSAEMLAAGKAMHLAQPHDRQKNYLLKEGAPIDFLVQLGIMTKDGKIHAQKYSKFRQINRFLEYVDDILPSLTADTARTQTATLKNSDCAKMMGAPEASETDETAPKTPEIQEARSSKTLPRTLEIVDFGCGKSYLTFAVYYYLTAIKGLSAHITGIDLKKDVIHHCKQLAAACGYTGMDFICGDVADFSGSTPPDLVITLHACDTATDYALSYAVKNGAKCILSVPCCQHELNSLTKKHVPDQAFSAMFKYGIIKERISALATDVMRAELLENSGYSTQILEFIDMEDTPKNLLIRAVKADQKRQKLDKPSRNSGNAQSGQTAPAVEPLVALQNAFGQTITLEKLLSVSRRSFPPISFFRNT